jgi:O-antigen/teichoic acid export membrane protein
MLKDLFKGSAIYGLAPFVPKILTVFLLPLLTKYLTSADYGVIGTITSIVFAIQALQDLGLKLLLPNYFYKCKYQYKVIWREIYGFLSLWMIIFAFIQASLLYFFIPVEAEPNKWLIILLSNFSTVFFGPTAIIGQKYYQLKLEPIPVAWRLVLSGVVTILVNCVCVVIFKWGYMGAYVGSFAGTFLANLTYWPVVNRRLGLSPIYCFKKRTIFRLLKVSMPTIPHNYTAYLMNSSNVVAMNYHERPISEVGHLTMAQQISGMFDTLINAINQVVGPMTYQYIRDKNSSELRRLVYSYILMTYSLTFIYSLWSREIYGILISNEEIAATYKYSIILVMALCYRPLYCYCCCYFIYYEHTAYLLGISLVSGIISCLFYFTMIPYMGIYAALIGFYIGCIYYGYVGYLYHFYNQKTIFRIRWYSFLIIQLVSTLFVYKGVNLSIMTKLFISIAFMCIMGYIFMSKIRYKSYNNIA